MYIYAAALGVRIQFTERQSKHSEEQGKGGTCVPGLVGCFSRFSASFFAALSLLLGLMSPWVVTETWLLLKGTIMAIK